MGVDIGGSHISAQLIDIQNRREIKDSWQRTDVDSGADAHQIIDVWAGLIEQSMKQADVVPQKINIAMPGPMDYANGICKIQGQEKYASLYGLNIRKLLAKRLDFDAKQINFLNDAECFLKGELFNGSLRQVDRAIGLTLGTGLGTAHTARGKVKDSDLWRMPFLKGKAEDYISTRWFVQRFEEMTNIRVKDVKDLVDHHSNSPYFNAVFLEFSINLSKFLYRFIRTKIPIAAVIGGNIAHAQQFFLEDTQYFLSKKMGYDFPIKISTMGEKAILMGAAANC